MEYDAVSASTLHFTLGPYAFKVDVKVRRAAF